ncbi:NYN domain-containing protein [Arsukibacterium ikkense]|nr:NYN domain-containing protein [Arsukibacterium ikkense]
MKIKIYIDGYNLYYGVLKNHPFKWLDPIQLVKNCCKIAAPEHIYQRLNGEYSAKYFTSKVLPKATFSKTAEKDQNAYHAALQSIYDDQQLEIVFGYHSINPVEQREFDPLSPKTPHIGCKKVCVWRIEEKQTDVNIAVQALKDAYEDPTEQLQIFVSNDTDLCPLLGALARMTHVKVGVIPPVNGITKFPASDLVKLADWSIHAVTERYLRDAQLPLSIASSVRSGMNGRIRKPLDWYGQPELANEIFSILYNSLRTRNKTFRWLEQAPFEANIPGLPNLPRPAIEMFDTVEDAALVKQHVIEYIKHCQP